MPSKFVSGIALKRFGAFVQEVTAQTRLDFQVGERAILVLNTPPYQALPFPHAFMFVEKGLEIRGQTVEEIEEKLNQVAHPHF